MYPILKVHPLILPKEQYVDRFGSAAAFVDMNPSMYIEADGGVIILVRRVNYRKFADRQFTLGSYPSESKYVVATGSIGDLRRLTVAPLKVDYGIPTYSTYWRGPEDIRFISATHVIATIPECNPTGAPAIFQGNLSDNTLKYVEPCFPNDGAEKNWMPYRDFLHSQRVIYSLSPFRVKHVKTGDLETLPIVLAELEGYHGSTNGIKYMGEFQLFLVHVNRERTYHRWLLFHPGKKTAKVSKEFVFFQHSYIEFPVSLCEHGERLYVSMGVNDEAAFVLELDYDGLMQHIDHHK